MTRTDIHAMHHIIEGLGIPLDSVHLQRDGKTVELAFLPHATEEQRNTAQQIADEWDQEARDVAKEEALRTKAEAIHALPTAQDIETAKKLDEVKTMALALRAFIDAL